MREGGVGEQKKRKKKGGRDRDGVFAWRQG